ncbi:hypothetical protein D3C87_1646050 [compost metagenome]
MNAKIFVPPVEPKMNATPYKKIAVANDPKMKYLRAASLESFSSWLIAIIR